MINIETLINKAKIDGYKNAMLEPKAAQDIILALISNSRFNKNITIKGGVVMRSLSKNVRRATLDIDFDLIHFPITHKGIRFLIRELNCNNQGIKISILGKIEKLKHQNYKGARISILIEDNFKNKIVEKIDIGVHKYMELEQKEYCFDLSTNDKGVVLLINTCEQMFTEKLKSLLHFGPRSKRYKDLYDMYYLISFLDKSKLILCVRTLIFKENNKIKNFHDIEKLLKIIFSNQTFMERFRLSNRNWLNIDEQIIVKELLKYISHL